MVLRSLEQVKDYYGEGFTERKLELLSRLRSIKLRSAREVFALHEALCFLRAYPDDAKVLSLAEAMLAAFHRRADLRHYRAALADSGIAGTKIHYRFFWPTARWLSRRHPNRLHLDRADREPAERIRGALALLVTPPEVTWLKESGVSSYAALDRLRARDETDGEFLVRRVAAMPGDAFSREAFFDAMDASFLLQPGTGTPSRTRDFRAAAPSAFRQKPPRRQRPELREEILVAPRSVRKLSPAEGARLIDLARAVMVARGRDLDSFAYGEPRDVRLVDHGSGFCFMVNGVVPERRGLVPAYYGFLSLQNGVPIGYGQLDFVGRSAAISFNTFATFRGAEAAWNFASLLAMARHVFGSRSFSLEPYQLGAHNEEAIASGAWWFYYKLGFGPRAPQALRVLEEELAYMKADPAHRSAKAALRKLAAWHLFFDLDSSHPAELPPLAELGERVAKSLAKHGGSDRKRAVKACEAEMMQALGLRSLEGLSPDERLAWSRWAPLVASISGVNRWNAGEKRTLVAVIRAKGARSESDFVARFAAHTRLAAALGLR